MATAIVCAASATPSALSALANLRFASLGHKQGLTKCPKCGKKVDPKWKFCDKCGAKLEAKKPPVTTGGGAGTTTGGGATTGGSSSASTTPNIHSGHQPMSTKGPAVTVDSNLGVKVTSGAQVARWVGINNDGTAIV